MKKEDMDALLGLRDAVRKWFLAEPESVKYPGPGDEQPLLEMEKALEATKGIRRP